MPKKVIRNINIPPHLRGPVLIDSSGNLRYWPTVYSFLNQDNSESTLSKKLGDVENFYKQAEKLGIHDLDAVIAALDIGQVQRILESLFTYYAITGTNKGYDKSSNWRNVISFVSDIMGRLVTTVDDTHVRNEIEKSLDRLGQFYLKLLPASKPGSGSKIRMRQALPIGVVQDLYEIVTPYSPRNPFRTEALQWRNFCLIMIFLHLGLRRGEATSLTLGAIKNNTDFRTNKEYYWLDITSREEHDPRKENSKIKNIQSHRRVPVPESVMEHVIEYRDNYRTKAQTAYLFSSSYKRPLTNTSVNKVFKRLSMFLSPTSVKLLEDHNMAAVISPHLLRHTCATYRISQLRNNGVSDEAAFQQMREFFGWARSSTMPQLYTQLYWNEEMMRSFNSPVDNHIDNIKKLDEVYGD
jgi:integrase